MPDQPTSDHSSQPLPWTPKPQSPADSYTSLRRFREQADAERRAQTGEISAMPFSGSPKKKRPKGDPPPTIKPGSDTSPLPRQGEPLFGPHGIVSRPLLGQPSTKRPGETLVGSQRPTTGSLPSFAHLFDTASTPITSPPAETAAKELPQEEPQEAPSHTSRWMILPRLPEVLRSFVGHGKEEQAHPMTRISRIATVLVGLVAIVVLIARPLVGSASAHPHTNTTAIQAGAGGKPVPTPTAPSYSPMALDTTYPPPVLWATSAYLMDETNGTVLYAKDPNAQLPMASTTKLMTAIVALEHASPDKMITITADAAGTFCTCLGLHAGEQYSLHDLLYGMLMISGNDAAEAIADGVGGNAAKFVGWMNATAVSLGLTHTHYANPHGLDDPQHYSSARDLAVLGTYALTIPLIHQIVQTRYYTIPATSAHPKHDLINQHQPLWWYPGADGGKPGWTGAAEFVDILSAVRNGHHLIAVVMHSEHDWVTDIRDLLNWGFDDFNWVSPHDILQKQYIPFASAYQNFTWDVPTRMITDGTRLYSVATGYSISGAFMTYFNANGGVSKFGLPEGMPAPSSQGQLKQRFQKSSIACQVSTGKCQTVS